VNQRLAVVTVVHGRHEHLQRQQRLISSGNRAPEEWVVVAMADPGLRSWQPASGVVPSVVTLDAEPACLPLAAARNLGAARALGRDADVLVFLDVDCLPGLSALSAYASAARLDSATIWSGPVTYLAPGLADETLTTPWLVDDPHPGRPAPAPGELITGAAPELFWSLSFGLSAAAWERSGGFHEGYVGYGAEDTDFAFQAVARGLKLGWVGSARAYHQYHATQDPPVQHLTSILRNARLFHQRWGSWPMEGWLSAFEELGLVERDSDLVRRCAEPDTRDVQPEGP
jgi:hypothetical protein